MATAHLMMYKALLCCLLVSHICREVSSRNVRALWTTPEPSLTLTLTELETRNKQRYSWSVTCTADRTTVDLAADKSDWLPVEYRVGYTKTPAAKATLSLAGNLLIKNDAEHDVQVSTPNITVTLNTGHSFQLPAGKIQCPTLTIPPSSVVTCQFVADKPGSRPFAGSVQASVEVTDTVQGTPATTVKAPPVSFDFSGATLVTEGDVAVISDFFEAGEGIVQPHSVSGKQPGANMQIGDSRTFAFTGWFGGINTSLCGKELKAINTAELTVTSSIPGEQLPLQTAAVTVKIVPNCAAHAASQASFSEVQLDRQPCGVSKQSCPPGYRCFDGFNCCPEATPVCGGKCCGGDWSCVGNVCVPPGAKACGKAVCDSLSGWECLETDLCCRQSDSVCNHRCCVRGNVCRAKLCVLPDEEPCGVAADGVSALRMCRLPTEFCADPAKGLCCNRDTQETPCGGMCCPRGYSCTNQLCTPPAPPPMPSLQAVTPPPAPTPPTVVVVDSGPSQQQQQQQMQQLMQAQQKETQALTFNAQTQLAAQQQAVQQQAQISAQQQAQQQAQFQAQLQAQLQAQQNNQQPQLQPINIQNTLSSSTMGRGSFYPGVITGVRR